MVKTVPLLWFARSITSKHDTLYIITEAQQIQYAGNTSRALNYPFYTRSAVVIVNI
jgi:hypothetical protein